jgi:hypothetical protein
MPLASAVIKRIRAEAIRTTPHRAEMLKRIHQALSNDAPIILPVGIGQIECVESPRRKRIRFADDTHADAKESCAVHPTTDTHAPSPASSAMPASIRKDDTLFHVKLYEYCARAASHVHGVVWNLHVTCSAADGSWVQFVVNPMLHAAGYLLISRQRRGDQCRFVYEFA